MANIIRPYDRRRSPEPMRGLGDAVHRMAQPIAKAIDGVLGTNVSGCGGCGKRREKLNEMFPFEKKQE